jgi:hypothetical protein
MSLHEAEHVLLEGGDMLLDAGVVTEMQLFEAR